MSGPKDNPAFVSDDGQKGFSSDNESNTDFHVMDIKDKKALEADEPYDPYKNRKVAHPTTNSETLLHLLKGSLGTGILAMPNAFYNSGYILGFIGTIVVGFICTYCIHLLLRAEYELCKRRKVPSLTYPKTAECAMADGPKYLKILSPYLGHTVNVFLLIYQLGTCCVYIIFVASNIQRVCNQYMDEEIDIKLYCLMLLLPLILINWIRNLKYLAPFSTVANGITVVGFAVIFYYLIDRGPTFENREAVGDLEKFPLFFGTVLFALEAIGVIMPLENEMKTPKTFGKPIGILNISMSIIVILYIVMGFLGYLTFGKASGSITLDLPNEEVLAQVIQGTLAIAIFITYALQCYVAVDITWNMYIEPKMSKHPRKLLWEYVCRTVIVLITFGLAVAIPKLELFISLFGALCLAALGIAIPALIDMSTHWYQWTGATFHLNIIKNVALIIFGLLGLVVGTYTALEAIVTEFENE